jgi:gliding motility-associated-like protein
MKKIFGIFILLFTIGVLQGQDFSNKGKEFWVGYGSHVNMYSDDGTPITNGGPQEMVFYFSSDRKAKVKIEIPNLGWIDSCEVEPGVIKESPKIPKSGIYDARLVEEGKSVKGIHITSDVPIIAYSHTYNQSRSGAALLYPVNVLSNEYYSLNFNQTTDEPNSNSFCFVIATEDNTEVEIIPKSNTQKTNKNVPIKVKLNKGEVYNVFGRFNSFETKEEIINGQKDTRYLFQGEDLSGTIIKSIGSCKKIAVFSGTGKINITCTGDNVFRTSGDNLIQQCLPSDAWGKKYLVVPTKEMTTNYYRILVKNLNTVVYRDGVPIAGPLINDSYYEFITSKPEVITSNGDPIMVAQYITSTNQCDNNKSLGFANLGDPEMIYLSPVEQSIDKITINSTPNFKILKHFINIVINQKGLSTLKVDGILQNNATPFQYDNEYAYLQIQLSGPGSHIVTSDIGFNAIAYGYGGFESYGYNAGSSVKNLNQYITTDNILGTVKSPATCQMTPFNLSLTLPYKPLSINWDFNNTGDLLRSDGTIAVNPGKFINPAGGTMIPDEPPFINPVTGKELYTYKVPGTYKYEQTNLNGYQISVSVEAPSNSLGCSGLQEIIYDVIVYNPPKTGIYVTSPGCINNDILFKAEDTIDTGMEADRYIWTFDGVLQNPIVADSIQNKFPIEGNHSVGVKVVTDIGCISPSFDSVVTVSNIPVVDFLPNPVRCNDIEFEVNDKSTLSGFYKLVKWDWRIDEKPEIINSTAELIKYSTTSDFSKIKLTVSSETGCKNSIEKSFRIFPNPEVAFTLPNFCLKDGEAEFTSTSSVSQNRLLTNWEWNFGDKNTPTSFPIQKTGEVVRYPFKDEGNYNVTLKVISEDKCFTSKEQSFTVNGATPIPKFDVVNESSLCSNNSIKIINNSEVYIGSVGETNFYFDYKQNLTTPEVIDKASKIGSEYLHKYDDFKLESKVYTLKMIAFSGKSCFAELTKDIIVYGSPEVKIPSLPSACSNGKTIDLPIASVLTVENTFGIGQYIGKGIIDNTKFDPGILDSGTYKVSYRYTTAKGCFDEKSSSVRVNFTPKISAGPDIQLLQDSTITIKASASGGIRYQWFPTNFLNASNILNPDIINPDKDLMYVLTVTGVGNCFAKDSIFLTALNYLKPPNTLVPGRPPYDKWVIDNIQKYKGCVLKIFDVNGRMIKTYDNGYDNNKPWNGTNDKDQFVPAGTYYYVLDPKNGRKVQTGYVTIHR